MTTDPSRVPLRVVVDVERMKMLIADKIRREMAGQRVSQTELARDVFHSYPQYVQRRYGGDDVAWSAADVAAIATYLGVPVQQFYGNATAGGPPDRPDGEVMIDWKSNLIQLHDRMSVVELYDAAA